jgi:hypothetical protein
MIQVVIHLQQEEMALMVETNSPIKPTLLGVIKTCLTLIRQAKMGTMILMELTGPMLSMTDDKVGGGARKERAGCSDDDFWTTSSNVI